MGMSVTMWNGLEIDVPDGWADVSTVVVAPRASIAGGEKPTINLVVKRRPMDADDTERSMLTYLQFMRSSLGELSGVETKDMSAGPIKGRAVHFSAVVDGTPVKQTTLLYFSGGEEISATVTQRADDATPAPAVEKLLRSVRTTRPAARGGRR
jgi:hypothetical protein